MLFLKLALLNIRKYKRRSAIIIFSVLLSVTFMVFVGGMMDGLRKTFFSDLLQQSGHLQIHEEGWAKRLNPYSIHYLINRPDKIIADVTAAAAKAAVRGKRTSSTGNTAKADLVGADIVHMEPLLHFGALLVHGDKNVAMVGQGVEPDTAFFRRVSHRMVAGTFLPTKAGSKGNPGVALSDSTARLLGLKLGDPVVVLVQDSSGSPYYLSYPLTGIFHSGVSDIDDTYFFLSLTDAQQLLNLPHKASEIRITLKDPAEAETAAAALSPMLHKNKLTIETWRQINGSIVVFIDFGDLYIIIINIFIVVVAATVITNSILMTVFERIPVFGTLRAIGLKRSQLFWMIVDEGVILGLIGGLLGLAVAVPFVLYLQVHGLNVGAMSSALGTGTTYHFLMTPKNGFLDFIGGVLIAIGGSLYAAWISARKRLIDSLREA